VGSLVALLGWQWGFWGPGLIGLVAAVGMYALVQDRPQTLGLPPVNEWKNDHYREQPKDSAKTTVGLQFSILKIPAIWVLALASATTYVTRYAINSWGVLYLQEARGYSLPMAGTLLMISTIAGVFGAVAFGFTSDKVFNARRPPANLLFALLELIGLVIIFFGPTNTPMLIVGMLLFGMGLTGLVTSLGGLFAIDIAPKRAAGAAMGVIGVFSYIGAAIQEQVSGLIINSNMVVNGGDRVYDFGPVIWFWIGSSVVSMLLAATLWRTRLRD
jgi:OPA family sugar phosphate sensor protein UhpC-like MFS transporter